MGPARVPHPEVLLVQEGGVLVVDEPVVVRRSLLRRRAVSSRSRASDAAASRSASRSRRAATFSRWAETTRLHRASPITSTSTEPAPATTSQR